MHCVQHSQVSMRISSYSIPEESMSGALREKARSVPLSWSVLSNCTDLAHVVRHRTIILPQLGAPGISWPEVIRRSGFKVEYGPVRASDLSRYLKTHTATPEMRRVRFPLADRLVLIPVELVHAALPAIARGTCPLFLCRPSCSTCGSHGSSRRNRRLSPPPPLPPHPGFFDERTYSRVLSLLSPLQEPLHRRPPARCGCMQRGLVWHFSSCRP